MHVIIHIIMETFAFVTAIHERLQKFPVTAIEYNCNLFERQTAIPFAAAQPEISERLRFLLARATEKLPKGAHAGTFAALGESPAWQLSCCYRCSDARLRVGGMAGRRACGREEPPADRWGEDAHPGASALTCQRPKNERCLAAELEEGISTGLK